MTIIKYFHFYCGIKQSFSELSSGITTARGCGVGGDLVQYLQVELKLKRGKVKVSVGGTQTKKFKRRRWRKAGFHPFFLCFCHMYYTIEHPQGTPYVFWENSVCFSRPGFNDTQEVRLSPISPKCCTFCHTRCASAQGTGATRTTPPPEPRTLTIRGLVKDQIQPLLMVS